MNKQPVDVFRRTKILTTLGPSTDSPETMSAMLEAGVNIVRLNCSHSDHDAHRKRIELVRQAAKEQNRWIGILADLQGPKIRVTRFIHDKVALVRGDTFVIDSEYDPNKGTQHIVGSDYDQLPNDVNPGDTLLLDDGRIKLSINKIDGTAIHCTVEVGGTLSNNKGINRQGGGLTAPALTEKDMTDLAFMLSLDVDYIAVSFPKTAADIIQARELIEKQGSPNVGIIAKIERQEALENIDEIIQASDGVMVARGDLAVEIGHANVPLAQKHIVQQARSLNKPVIIATQMMESMINEPVPTRAEVNDVAIATLDNTDAVMLSAESAVGTYPVQAVLAMANICKTVESNPDSQKSRHRVECQFLRTDEAIAMATMYTANHYHIACIIALTESGSSTLWMSRIRTSIPIFALSRDPATLRKISLYRGVYPLYFDPTTCTIDDVDKRAVQALLDSHYLEHADSIILTKGNKMGVGGGSNTMKILQIGKILKT